MERWSRAFFPGAPTDRLNADLEGLWPRRHLQVAAAGRSQIYFRTGIGRDECRPDRSWSDSFSDSGDPIRLLRGSDGSAAQQLNEQTPFMGTSTLESQNEEPNQITLGWVRILTEISLGAGAIFRIFQWNNLQTAAAVLPRPLTSSASFAAKFSGAVRTGLAVLNPLVNRNPTNVWLTLFDEGGNQIADTVIPLEAGQKESAFLDKMISGLQDFNGSVQLKSDFPVAVLPLQQEGVVLTTLDVFPGRH